MITEMYFRGVKASASRVRENLIIALSALRVSNSDISHSLFITHNARYGRTNARVERLRQFRR